MYRVYSQWERSKFLVFLLGMTVNNVFLVRKEQTMMMNMQIVLAMPPPFRLLSCREIKMFPMQKVILCSWKKDDKGVQRRNRSSNNSS